MRKKDTKDSQKEWKYWLQKVYSVCSPSLGAGIVGVERRGTVDGAAVQDKRTMTLNLTAAEMEVLEALARRKDLSKTAVIRQALRLLQLVDTRVAQGEKLFFEDEVQKKKAELMVL